MAPIPRILYMGYGAIGTQCLRELVAAGLDVVGVFARESDRRELPSTEQETRQSVYTLAGLLELRRFPATEPSDPAFLEEARALAPDYLISIQYDRILQQALIELPPKGCLNLHFSALPRLRGCFPTKWAIINGEPSGVTLHYIDRGVDSGPILDQMEVTLAPDETDESLYAKLVKAGEDLFKNHVSAICEGTLPSARPQDSSRATYHPKSIPHDGVIDWARGAAWVERFIRAFTFPPYPGAKTWASDREVQFRAPVTVLVPDSRLAPGELHYLADGAVEIGCGAGRLLVREMLLDGQLLAASRLRGLVPEGGSLGSARRIR